MQFMGFLFLATLAISPAAQSSVTTEAECQPVDYSAKFGEARDQGHTSLCAFFTAADLLAYKLDVPLPERVSAVDLSLQYWANFMPVWKKRIYGEGFEGKYQDWKNNFRSFGQMKIHDRGADDSTIIHALLWRKQDICLESQVPSEAFRASESQVFVERYLKDLTGSDGAAESVLYGTAEGTLDPNRVQNQVRKTESYAELLQRMRTKVNAQCTARVSLKSLTPEQIGSFTGEPRELIATLNSELTRHPVGVSYPVYSMYNILNRTKLYNTPGAELDIHSFQDRSLEVFSLHASIVVARKWNRETSQCTYKIRNSWGKRCDIYDDKFKKTCKDGQFWVSDADARNLFKNLSWIN